MIKHVSVLFALMLILSCGNEESNAPESPVKIEKEVRHGGVFRMPLESQFTSARINEVKKYEESQIYWQIFDGLVKYNAKTLEIEPAFAEKWEVSSDGLEYTFNLRENVKFHDNACFEKGIGRNVTPADVIYTFECICEKSPSNNANSVFKNTIEGGDKFHTGCADNISGINNNGNTITFKLKESSLTFIKKLATVFGAIVAEEAFNRDTLLLVGTGPFKYDSDYSDSSIVKLSQNADYYALDEFGDQLPYLDSVIFVYYEDENAEMDHFWDGQMAYIREVPVNKSSDVLEEKISDFESRPPKYVLHSEPESSATYLELNMTTPVLKNKKVRKALNYSFDRNKLVEKTLKNQAYGAVQYGITPPLRKYFNNYDGIRNVSYMYNPDTTRALLAAAGYPDGRNFPTLEMQFRLGSVDYLIASEIQCQLLHVLNINIEIGEVEFNVMLNNKSKGEADIFRTIWIGDYPTPEAFLANAYGKDIPKSQNEPTFLNISRYHNPKFDELFEKGTIAQSEKEANGYFSEAEKVLMEDAVFIILWHGENIGLEQASLRNFKLNSIGHVDLRDVYFKELTAEEYTNKK